MLVEAASYRIPIISSNFKSGAKEILLNGRAGNLFNCKDYIGLSLLIDKFYLKREDFIKKEKICSSQLMRFSNKKIVKEFNNLLNRL